MLCVVRPCQPSGRTILVRSRSLIPPIDTPPAAAGGTSETERDGRFPTRTCVGCRQKSAASALLRIVARDGRLVVDARHRLPGRGAWLHPQLDCLEVAVRRRAFGRALRLTGEPDSSPVRSRLQGPVPGADDEHDGVANRDLPDPESTGARQPGGATVTHEASFRLTEVGKQDDPT